MLRRKADAEPNKATPIRRRRKNTAEEKKKGRGEIRRETGEPWRVDRAALSIATIVWFDLVRTGPPGWSGQEGL